jgi:predicted permease
LGETFAIVLPIFGLIATGWLVGRTRLLSEEGIRGINAFVLYVAVPALLFRTMARGLEMHVSDLALLLAYYGGTLASFAVALGVGALVFRLPLAERALFGMGAMFSNSVLMGIPLVLAVYGAAGETPLTLIIAVHSLILLPLVTVLIEIGKGEGANAAKIARNILRGIATNPILIGLGAGLVWAALGWELPEILDIYVSFMARAASPVALFAVGATLAGFAIRGDLAPSLTAGALKLALHPLLVWLLATYVFALDPVWTAVAVTIAALPAGATVFVMARGADTYVNRASATVMLSTLVSVVSLAAWIALVG